MARTRFKKTGDWKKIEKAFDPRVLGPKLKKNMKRATALNGKLAERAIRRAIQSGGLDANAELTIMIKGSSKPLVDSGVGLFQAITSKVLDERTVFAGVLRTEAKFNIAIALHEGTEIKVTPAMRGMFFWLWQASIGAIPSSRLEGRASELWERAPGGWAPLKEGTSHIIIPSRPFMKQAFADGALKRKAKENWQMAVKKTMRELAQ